MNGSLRGRFARFNRRTKAHSKSYEGLYNAVFLWVNRNMLIENRVRYSSYCGRCESNNGGSPHKTERKTKEKVEDKAA
jgi:hypothetical protein